jgi:membrane protein implicated in regulation of membrane protease activity
MNTKALLWFGLSLICAVAALIIFFRGLDLKALLFLVFGVAAAGCLKAGLSETKKKS